MVNFSVTAVLVSNKNMDLSYKVNTICKELKINLIYVINYIDLTFKVANIKPSIIIYDMETVNFDPAMIGYVSTNEHYENIYNIFVKNGPNEVIDSLNNDRFISVSQDELTQYIEKLFYELQITRAEIKNKSVTADEQEMISAYLRNLGISPRLCGYRFLKEIIIETFRSYNGELPMLRECYAIVSSRYNTKPINIERSIRHAIKSAWTTYGAKNWKDSFDIATEDYDKPSIREFISNAVEQVHSMFSQYYSQQNKRYI